MTCPVCTQGGEHPPYTCCACGTYVVVCPTCGGDGTLTVKGMALSCPTCHGLGTYVGRRAPPRRRR